VALGAALCGMVARASGGELEDAAGTAARADDLRGRAARLMAEDSAAYAQVLAADDEGARRTALERASDVPLAVAEAGAEVSEIAAGLAREGNPTLRGDALAAAALAEAGAEAAAALVSINQRAAGSEDDRTDRAAAAAARAAAARRGAR
jgi:formiminotetrahydrofolate cyclodeaminase